MTASFQEQPADWTRAQWLQWRRQGIGASDVGSICGLSTFGSPTSVYYEKLGLSSDAPENEPQRWGRLLEAPIAAEFTERTGLHVVCPQLLVWDEEKPHRRATLDGLAMESRFAPAPSWWAIEDVLGTIQIKTTRDHSWVDGIPDRVALQCQWEMGVAGLTHCWLAVLHGGQRLDVYELDFEPLIFERLCAIVDRFWQEHVLAENPPPADSNPATTQALKDAFAERADDSTHTIDPAVAVEWMAAKAALKVAESRVELFENKLRAELGEAVFGADPDGTDLVSWKPQSSGARLDAKRLKAERPDIAAEYTPEVGVTRVLRATKALKDRVAPAEVAS